MSITARVTLALERTPRPLADSELVYIVTTYPAAELREIVVVLAQAGVLESERRVTADGHGREIINEFYRLSGSMLPWPGRSAAEVRTVVHPDPDAIPFLSEEEERLLAAATLVADEYGRLNAGPLREAAGVSEKRTRAAIARLRSAGAWPYKWRYIRLSDEESELRVAAARRLKAERGGERLSDGEFDELYGEGAA